MISEISILSFVLQNLLAYHGAMYGYYHDRDQRYYLQPNSYNYDWPKRHIRKLRPRHNRIHRIGERYMKDNEDSSEDCQCSCNDCVLPKLCCVPTCAACAVYTDVLYVPYPFPIIVTMPNNKPTYPSTTRSSTRSTTRSTTTTDRPRTESTTPKPCTPRITPVLTTPNIRTTFTTRNRPTITTRRKVTRRITAPPGAPGNEQEDMMYYPNANFEIPEYADNLLYGSTQPPKTRQRHCPLAVKCSYHPRKYQGLRANRRAVYGRRRTSNWFANVERALRQTTRDWLPKYGIVSIPDHLAKYFVQDVPDYDMNNLQRLEDYPALP